MKGKEAFALASMPVAEGGERIGYLIREEGRSEGDSGWRVLSGNESPLYFMEPDCLVPVAIDALLKSDPEIGNLLNAPVGTEYRRDEDGIFTDAGWKEGSAGEKLMGALSERPARSDSAPGKALLLIIAAAVLYALFRLLR